MQPTETSYEVWVEKLKTGWTRALIEGEPRSSNWKEAQRTANEFVNDGLTLRYVIVTNRPVKQGNCVGLTAAMKMGLNRPGVTIEGSIKIGPAPTLEIFQK